MATRSRARSSTPKTTVSAGADTAGTQASGIQEAAPARQRKRVPTNLSGATTTIPEANASDPAVAADEVKFVGEQLNYKSRYERIAESAYAYAQARGFAPGGEVDDWLRAEREVDALLAGLDGDRAD
jgi:hypothetical protein